MVPLPTDIPIHIEEDGQSYSALNILIRSGYALSADKAKYLFSLIPPKNNP